MGITIFTNGPSEEAGEDEKRMTEEVLHSSGVASTLNVAYSNAEAIRRDLTSGIKRMCQLDDDSDLITDEIPVSKWQAADPRSSVIQSRMSRALQNSEESGTITLEAVRTIAYAQFRESWSVIEP